MKMRRKATRGIRTIKRSFNLESLENRQLLSSYFVSTAGSDTASGSASAPWKTLQKAVDSVRAGDTVNVAAGDYAGFAKYGLKGTASAHIVFKAEQGVNIVSKSQETAVDCGIELSGYDQASGSAYVDLYGFNVNNASGNISGAVSSGIRIRNSSNIGIYNCTASNNGWVGIYCAYVNNITLDGVQSFNNNLFVDAATQRNHGIYIANSSSNVTIRNAVVHDNNGNGIHANGDGGVNSGFLYENNTVYNNGTLGGSAMNCDGLQNSTIRNNLLYGNRGKGISLYNIDATGGSMNNTIVNNTVIMPSSTGNVALQLKDAATGNKIFNNIFLHQGTAPAISMYSTADAGSQIDYNIYGGPSRMMSGDGSGQTFSEWRTNNPAYDAHSFTSTAGALFVNAGANDFHLSATSPAIDKGISLTGVVTDILGLLRPLTGVDIGAFEYGASTGGGTTPTPTPTAPAAPSGLAALALTSSQVSLSWVDNADNESNFIVERSLNGGAFVQIATLAANTFTYTDNGLTGSSNYAYRVLATNGGGNSDYSNTATVTTPIALLAPVSPNQLVATAQGSSSIALTWADNSSNETNFRIDRSTSGGMYQPIAYLNADTTSYVDSRLAAGTNYSYRVRAYNAVGSSVWSNLASATTLGVAPVAPSNLSATAGSATQVTLAWNDNSTNETGFKVERATGTGAFVQIAVTAAGATGYVDATAAEGTTYSYRVRATNAIGDSAYTTTATATTPVAPRAPVSPTNLSATADSSSQVTLAWTDASDNETGFKIYRAATGGIFVQIGTVGAGVSSYVDTSVSANASYSYRMRATNSIGDSAYTDVVTVTTPLAPQAPVAPTALSATATSPSQIVLSWTDNSNNETGFRIERATGAGSFAAIATLGAGVTSYADNGLAASTSYNYRVMAFNAVGDSGQTNVVGATTLAQPTAPVAPSTVVAAASGTSQVALSWSDNADNETSFVVERAIGAGAFAAIATLGTDTTSYLDTTVVAATSYTYRVKAMNAVGSSVYSNTASATTAAAPSVPVSPNQLAASAVDSTTVDLTWADNSSNETNFRIDRSSDGFRYAQIAVVGADTTSYRDTGLSASTTYTYRVRAYNAVGISVWSNLAPVTTLQAPPPAAPAALSATVTGPNTVDLGWYDQSSDETGFSIERNDGNGFVVLGSVGAGVTNWTDATAIENVNYTYRVQALGAGGRTSDYSNSTSATISMVAPTNLSAIAGGSDQIVLTWTDTTASESGFVIERSTDFSTYVVVGTVGAGVTSYTDLGLSSDTIYSYQVRASNAFGSSDASATASAKTDDVAPLAPSDLLAAATGAYRVDLSWTDQSSNETYFAIERSTAGGDFLPVAFVTSGQTSWSDNNVDANTTYSYRVYAINAVGNSALSNVASATTTLQPLSAPLDLHVTALSTKQLYIDWTVTTDQSENTVLQRSSDGVNWTTMGVFVPSTNTYIDMYGEAGTTYQYRVGSVAANAPASEWSAVASATTMIEATPPAVPSAVHATALSATQIRVDWLSSEKSEQTVLQRSTDGLNWTTIDAFDASVSSYVDSDLLPNVSYQYRVEALNAQGASDWSTLATAKTLADTTPPTATLTTSAIQSRSTTSLQLTVTYTDDVAVKEGTIDGRDIIVTGPKTYRQAATLLSLVQDSNGAWIATYSITGPHGDWSSRDSGSYLVTLQSNQVTDTSGNAAVAQSLGYLKVSIA
ncbi:MAG TPA: fibronectin type III domain-containing protein [Tepidisphaeraceae bacterium]|jgi:titin